MNLMERFLAIAVATHFSAPGTCKGVYMTVNVVKIKVGLDFGDFAVVIRFPASKQYVLSPAIAVLQATCKRDFRDMGLFQRHHLFWNTYGWALCARMQRVIKSSAVCRVKTAFPMGLGTWEFQ